MLSLAPSITYFPYTTLFRSDRTYDAVVAIDPEALGTVVDEAGDRPERWIMVSKGRGSEAHKGNVAMVPGGPADRDRKSTRLNSSHGYISYAVFCLKQKKETT